jgi:NADH-quinone oxidoreductase subunit J
VEAIISPIFLLVLCAVGALGLCLALPRRGATPQLLGALVAGVAAGAVILTLTLKNPSHAPNIYFYLFSAVALGSSLRVITHPKPVYAALYFILTIIASAGLYLLMAAEFVSFALIIVYAGAILITYLFVIMLASQSPTEDMDRGEAEYDVSAREPIAASVVGFLLLATLTSFAFRGAVQLPESVAAVQGVKGHVLASPNSQRETQVLAAMPRRLKEELVQAGLMHGSDEFVTNEKGDLAVDTLARTVQVKSEGIVKAVALPEGAYPLNVESVGFNLLKDHPGSIEIAGVILLMAMLGAVVLSRKQVELDEELKRRQAHTLAETAEGGAA